LDTNKQAIKVMAEYESFPLWRTNSDGTANVDPASLPISRGLAQTLLDWADSYDRTLNRDDPLASGFPDTAAEDDFYAHGERLARQLATELGTQYTVEYFDGRSGRTTPVP
jgi:hypothetical protein